MIKKISVVVIVVISIGMLVWSVTRMFAGVAGGIDSIDVKELMWVKCKACGADYQTSAKAYYEFQEAHKASMSIRPLKCEKCGQSSVYKAVKCEKCEFVFLEGSVANTFADTCPKCMFSKTKQLRNGTDKQ